jgi:biotin carboxylase
VKDRGILFVTTTTGYQARAFERAAAELGVALVHASDRCNVLEDPWRDGAIPVDFRDEEAAARLIETSLAGQRVSGVVASGDRPARVAAAVAPALGVRYHTLAGVRAATNKLAARGRWLAAGLPMPWFVRVGAADTLGDIADRVRFPAVVKPLALSGSRGVIRVDDGPALEEALSRVRRILRSPDVRAAGAEASGDVLVEGFVPGRELALEGVMEDGMLRVLAIFDKPDPLDGPYFEETIYVTPAALGGGARRVVAGTIAHAALALGLNHGPIHAECRVNDAGVFVLEVAPRPIGGLCARVLRFASERDDPVAFEELLLRHARGEVLARYGREAGAAGVMMLPIPREGRLRRVHGIAAAEAVPHVDEVAITAKPDQLLVPLPEGTSYLGFIFARAAGPREVVAALRDAHAALTFDIDASIPVG